MATPNSQPPYRPAGPSTKLGGSNMAQVSNPAFSRVSQPADAPKLGRLLGLAWPVDLEIGDTAGLGTWARSLSTMLQLLHRGIFSGICGCALLLLTVLSPAASMAKESPAGRAERLFYEAQAHFQKHSDDPEAAWRFALACFDWSDLPSNDSHRAEIAQKGIDAARRALERNPKLAAAHYYLGLNLGELARTKKLGALKLVDEMETEFKTAITLDPHFDYAGPHRSIGLLYRDAPGWPASLGSRSKAKLHLKKAVELGPDYPDNWLSLLESYLKWGEKNAVESQLLRVEQVMEQARKTLTGEAWEASWQDWEPRWEKVKAKIAMPSRRSESPRHKE